MGGKRQDGSIYYGATQDLEGLPGDTPEFPWHALKFQWVRMFGDKPPHQEDTRIFVQWRDVGPFVLLFELAGKHASAAEVVEAAHAWAMGFEAGRKAGLS